MPAYQRIGRRVIPAIVAMALMTGAGCGLSADVHRGAGYDAYRRGDVAEARTRFEKCVAQDATDWKSHYYLGRIALDSDNDAYRARRHLESAYSLREALPDSPLSPQPGASQTSVPFPTRAEITDALAESMFRQGLRDRLYHFLRQQVDGYGETSDYLRLARYLTKLGDRDAAELAYRQATQTAEVDNAQVHLEFADYYDSVGDRAAALIELRKAYYIDPKMPGLADNIRAHGMVPGPTVRIAPERIAKTEGKPESESNAAEPEPPSSDGRGSCSIEK